MKFDEIIKHVLAGHQILIAEYSARERDNEMRHYHEMWSLAKPQLPGLTVKRPSMLVCEATGGRIHFVTNEEQVRGMEYHAAYDGSGHVTEIMRSRVRL